MPVPVLRHMLDVGTCIHLSNTRHCEILLCMLHTGRTKGQKKIPFNRLYKLHIRRMTFLLFIGTSLLTCSGLHLELVWSKALQMDEILFCVFSHVLHWWGLYFSYFLFTMTNILFCVLELIPLPKKDGRISEWCTRRALWCIKPFEENRWIFN